MRPFLSRRTRENGGIFQLLLQVRSENWPAMLSFLVSWSIIGQGTGIKSIYTIGHLQPLQQSTQVSQQISGELGIDRTLGVIIAYNLPHKISYANQISATECKFF